MRLFDDQAVSEFIAQGWWTGDTWGDCLRRSVVRFPERECLTDAPNKADFMGRAPLRLTWSEFEAAVDRCAEILYGHGIRKEDVVGVQIPNAAELMITYLALNRLGAILAPYPVAYRRHELSQLASIAGVHAIVTTAGYVGRDLREDAAAVLETVHARGGMFAWHAEDGEKCHGLDLADVLKGPRGDVDYGAYVHALQPHPNDCVMILSTSGTTGVPKAVPRGHGDSLVSASATVAAPGLTYRDVVLAPMPMVNGGALTGMFLPWLLTGCRLVLHQPFNLEIFASQIETESVTYSVAPPTILNDMVSDDAIFTRHDLSSLRVLGSGSAPLSAWMIKCWESDHGVEIINYFGATEGLQLIADRDAVPDPGLRARYLPRPGSPHFPWRTELGRRSESRLVDPLTGEVVSGPGRHGELRVKGPNIFSGYLNSAEDAFDELGYYRTGDLFEYSPDHLDLLILVDRAKDVIIRGGLNISAVEIEELLVAHPKVAEVAAVGKKDQRLGERTCVFVVPRRQSDPPTLAELVDFLNGQQVAKFKLPEFLELIETMPRNPAGKAMKVQLRRMVNGDDGTATGQ